MTQETFTQKPTILVIGNLTFNGCEYARSLLTESQRFATIRRLEFDNPHVQFMRKSIQRWSLQTLSEIIADSSLELLWQPEHELRERLLFERLDVKLDNVRLVAISEEDHASSDAQAFWRCICGPELFDESICVVPTYANTPMFRSAQLIQHTVNE